MLLGARGARMFVQPRPWQNALCLRYRQSGIEIE
jgi:hypothetical protein